MQAGLAKARSTAEAEREAREDAAAAVAKLQSVFAAVREELAQAQEDSQRVGVVLLPLCRVPLRLRLRVVAGGCV